MYSAVIVQILEENLFYLESFQESRSVRAPAMSQTEPDIPNDGDRSDDDDGIIEHVKDMIGLE